MFSVFKIWAITLFAGFFFVASAFAGPFILVDIKNGEVIAADRPTDPWYPASITKLMTLYVVAEAVQAGRLSLTSTLTMSKTAARVQPSKMGFKPGTKVTIENALPMLIVKSANDIAGAIAERVSGSQSAFVAQMNKTAQRLGMSGSRFTNPHGLPSKGQYVTARDMALLGLAIHKNFPELLPLFDIPAIRSGDKVLRSYNLLLEHYRGASGMKTGFICASGLNMVASAKRGRKQYLAVLLGEPSTIDRTEKAALLLEYAFSGKARKIGKRVDRYNPRPTRTTPVNMRPVICGGNSKIRSYQLITPPPKPKKGIFARDKYVSPQRKNFGRNLGDATHPQGALVHAPKGRKYRSHILQPRQSRDILRVRTGSGQRVVNARYTIKQSARAAKRQKAEAVGESNLLDSSSSVALTNIPKPKQKPTSLSAASVPASASAFANANNGVGASAPARNGSLLVETEKPDVVTGTGVIASSKSRALNADGVDVGGALLPRPNPVR
ncbi:MAG: D-alanyl-D-alanine carboxypeptidase family protein [Hyphomicrobiales bacterium]